MTTDSVSSSTTECKSCLGCRFLIQRDDGYSNWTVENTKAHCILDANGFLPEDIPDDICGYKTDYKWVKPEDDKWYATKTQRCDKYQYSDSEPIKLDVEGDKIMTIKMAESHFFKTGDGMPLRIARYFNKEEGEYVDYFED
jgi:hypothetical protein